MLVDLTPVAPTEADYACLPALQHVGLRVGGLCRAQRRLCIINCLWILDCLRAWRLLPEGEHMRSTRSDILCGSVHLVMAAALMLCLCSHAPFCILPTCEMMKSLHSCQVCALMHWRLTADEYTDNIDPGQDPMRGARVCASYVDPLGSLGGTVQDSEDEDEPAQQPGDCSICGIHKLPIYLRLASSRQQPVLEKVSRCCSGISMSTRSTDTAVERLHSSEHGLLQTNERI